MLHNSLGLPTAVVSALRKVAVLALLPAFWLAPAEGAGPSQQQMQQQMIQQAQQQQQAMMRMIQQAQQQMQRQAQQAQRQAQIANRNMTRQAQQAARNARNMPRPVIQNVTAEYEIIVCDDGLVRTMSLLAPELDEKGRPKKLDAEEKKKLKGDTPEERKLVGYKAGVEDLQPGDEVVVTLSRHRPSKRKSPGEDTEKESAKDKDDAKKDKDDAKKDKDDAKKDKDDAKKDDAKKDKDADGDKKEAKGDKEKSKKDKDSEGDESDSAHKLANLKEWKAQGKLHGIIAEVDMSGSRRLVLAIQGQQVVMQQPNNKNGNNKNNNNNKPTKAPLTSIDPSIMQGTFIVIVKRGDGGAAGGSGGFGFGATKKQ